MTDDFALNHNKSLQFYFCVKSQAKNDFLKDFKSIADERPGMKGVQCTHRKEHRDSASQSDLN